MNIPAIAIDLETTGLEPSQHGICEIGAVATDRFGKRTKFSIDVHDLEASWDARALGVNGFKPERIRAAAALGVALRDLEIFIDGEDPTCVFVFHNAPFDVAFIRQAYRKSNRHILPDHYRRVLDTASLGFMAGIGDYKKVPSLKELCAACSVTNKAPHTALGDAEATLDVFEYIMSSANER